MSQAHGKNLDNARGKVIAALLRGVCMHFLKTKAIQVRFVETVQDCATPHHLGGIERWLAENERMEIHCLLRISSYMNTYGIC